MERYLSLWWDLAFMAVRGHRSSPVLMSGGQAAAWQSRAGQRASLAQQRLGGAEQRLRLCSHSPCGCSQVPLAELLLPGNALLPPRSPQAPDPSSVLAPGTAARAFPSSLLRGRSCEQGTKKEGK